MNRSRVVPVPRGFLLRWVVVWVVAATIGGLVSGFAGGFPLWSNFDFVTFRLATRLVAMGTGILAAALLGSAQWRLLRELLPALGWRAWVGASVATAVIARAFFEILQSYSVPTTPPAPIALTMLNIALGMGLSWWVLSRHVTNGWVWAGAYTVGTLTSMALVRVLGQPLAEALMSDGTGASQLGSFAAVLALFPALSALPPALATGWAIPRLAPRPPSANMERHDERTEPAL